MLVTVKSVVDHVEPLRSVWTLDGTVTFASDSVLAAVVNTTVVAGENLTVGSTVWLPAEGLAPGR